MSYMYISNTYHFIEASGSQSWSGVTVATKVVAAVIFVFVTDLQLQL